MKDKDLNLIGKMFLAYNIDNKAFNDEVDRYTDCDLYTLYERKKHIKRLCEEIVSKVEQFEICIDFKVFRDRLLKIIDDKIYSREIIEKNENNYYDN